MPKIKRQKKQTIELELNRLTAEVLLQTLRHPNWIELKSAVKESLEYEPGDKIQEALEYLENEVADQISWALF
jgi:hypothetical protein